MSNYSEVEQINNLVRLVNYLCLRIDGGVPDDPGNTSSSNILIDDYTLVRYTDSLGLTRIRFNLVQNPKQITKQHLQRQY
jgi:hypothetical protein